MSDPCPVCVSPMLLTVVSLAEQGSGVSEIADSTGLTQLEIERHFEKCCASIAVFPEKDSLNASDERLRQLQERISLAISVSGVQGDIRSHLTGLSLAIRAELELRRRLEEQAALDTTANPDPDALTLSRLDQLVKNYVEKAKAESLCRFCGQLKPEEAYAKN
jgi:hypothetical protein